ncbi:MAG: iron hydrogenase small subunit [Ignavibacteriales bacterium]|nr:iron hydrogenase small subunit [Ignavibacteriales bacterium]
MPAADSASEPALKPYGQGCRASITSTTKNPIKVSHRNPEIAEIYKNFLGEPLGHKSHDLLHTDYKERDEVLLISFKPSVGSRQLQA